MNYDVCPSYLYHMFNLHRCFMRELLLILPAFFTQMIVAGFAGKTDLSKAAETANEVRRVMKDLKDSQNQGVLFNQRERLFGMQVTQVSRSCSFYVIYYM